MVSAQPGPPHSIGSKRSALLRGFPRGITVDAAVRRTFSPSQPQRQWLRASLSLPPGPIPWHRIRTLFHPGSKRVTRPSSLRAFSRPAAKASGPNLGFRSSSRHPRQAWERPARSRQARTAIEWPGFPRSRQTQSPSPAFPDSQIRKRSRLPGPGSSSRRSVANGAKAMKSGNPANSPTYGPNCHRLNKAFRTPNRCSPTRTRSGLNRW